MDQHYAPTHIQLNENQINITPKQNHATKTQKTQSHYSSNDQTHNSYKQVMIMVNIHTFVELDTKPIEMWVIWCWESNEDEKEQGLDHREWNCESFFFQVKENESPNRKPNWVVKQPMA